jgi:hypothetical protein
MAKKRARNPDDGNSAHGSAFSRAGMGCLLLFSLPFAAGGAWMAWMTLSAVWEWRAAQLWAETPATLLQARLEVHHDDSTTYRPTARYRYDFNGQRYVNDRVVLHGGSDNIGSYQRDRGAELERILKAGGETVCYVDPADPAQAMLFRDLRLGLLAFQMTFALVFGGIGFGLLAGGLIGRRKQRRKLERQEQFPSEPWRWREDWAAGRIRSSEGVLMWFATLFAGVWNAVSWPIAAMAWRSAARDNGPPIWLVGLFPLVGTGLAAWAGYLWLRRLRWGVSEFEMASVPGVLGGPLAGVIHAPASVVPVAGFRLRLLCNETVEKTGGGDSSTSTDNRWTGELTVLRQLLASDGRRTLIPVKFLIPYELPPSGDKITWQLEVSAEALGPDYFAAFEVPVFKTAASTAKITEANADAIDEHAPEPDLRTTVARMNAVLEEEMPHRRVIRFPMMRNLGPAAFSALFAVIWTGACVGLYLSDVPRVVVWGFAAFEVLVVYAAVQACFSSTRLVYSSRGIEYSHRILGVGRTRELARSDVKSVGVDKSGTNMGSTAFRKIVAETADGEATLAKEIASRQDAERLAADIRGVLGLDEPPPAMPLDAELPADFRGD